ncbi:hypothetical protein SRM1_05423 [Pseudomonas fluorescens]|nr:hypothetical protein SRM1_05423 [Pseudomonas fluorescens]
MLPRRCSTQPLKSAPNSTSRQPTSAKAISERLLRLQRETVASRSSIKSMRFPLALKSVQKLLQQVIEEQLSALGGRQT